MLRVGRQGQRRPYEERPAPAPRLRFGLDRNAAKERLDLVYWIDGEYVPEAVSEVSHLMRDWRLDLVRAFDTRALDVLSAAHRALRADEPFQVISGYRSPQTNAMLRRKGRGVARNSYHMKAMAIDVRMKSRSAGQIADAGRSLKAGGVGRYSRSNFAHLDCGPVRSWGR